jgi:hypothetical protein
MSTLNGGPGNIVTNGLVLYLDAANYLSYTSGSTTWNDLSGNNNSGSLVNGPTFSSTNAGSIVFDGTNDYVLVNSLPITGNQSITISAWINVISNINADNVLMIYGNPGTQLQTAGIYYRTTDSYVRFTAWGSTGVDYSTGFLKDFNTWHNWVMVYNTTDMVVYRDGVVDPNGPQSRSLNFQTNRFILAGTVSNGVYSNQHTATSQIYNRALSAQEVLQNYNAIKGRFGL